MKTYKQILHIVNTYIVIGNYEKLQLIQNNLSNYFLLSNKEKLYIYNKIEAFNNEIITKIMNYEIGILQLNQYMQNHSLYNRCIFFKYAKTHSLNDIEKKKVIYGISNRLIFNDINLSLLMSDLQDVYNIHLAKNDKIC